MSTLLNTLPGDIPGLLRRGSPVLYRGRRHVCEDPAEAKLGGLWLGHEQFAAVELDLTDATGRAHAAWWALAHPKLHRDPAAFKLSMGNILRLAHSGFDMSPDEIDLMARLCLRLAGRTP